MSEKATIKLKYPIDVKTASGAIQSMDSLTIGRIKAKHLKLLPKGLMGGEEGKANFEAHEIIPLVAGLTGISEEEAGELDFEDLMVVTDEVTKTMGEATSQKTGKK